MTLGCVVFAANLLFMIWWLCLDRLEVVSPSTIRTEHSYDAISLQITILGVMLASMAIGLGIAAVFGFQALRDHMLMRVDEQINQRFQSGPTPKDAPDGIASKGPTAPIGDVGIAQVTEG
jgi:hypothetical protein